MILVFLGPPGSGKGTQAKRLSAERHWPQLSTGDMLRAAIASGTPEGEEAASYINKGCLVPDHVAIGLIRERIKNVDCKNGFILDGFPRTVPQAEALDEMLHNLQRKVSHVILFNMEDAELMRRLTGRRTCLKCGAMYHVYSHKPKKDGICDVCGASLVQRDDDKDEVIQNRLEIYHKQTEPVAKYYNKNKRLQTLDASRSAAEVAAVLNQALAK